jgi:hypothetical protein
MYIYLTLPAILPNERRFPKVFATGFTSVHPAQSRRANMAHIRQAGPDSGLGLRQNFFNPFALFPLRSDAIIERMALPESLRYQIHFGAPRLRAWIQKWMWATFIRGHGPLSGRGLQTQPAASEPRGNETP